MLANPPRFCSAGGDEFNFFSTADMNAGKQVSRGVVWLGLMLALAPTACSGQAILGRTVHDKFVDGFWRRGGGTNTNENSVVLSMPWVTAPWVMTSNQIWFSTLSVTNSQGNWYFRTGEPESVARRNDVEAIVRSGWTNAFLNGGTLSGTYDADGTFVLRSAQSGLSANAKFGGINDSNTLARIWDILSLSNALGVGTIASVNANQFSLAGGHLVMVSGAATTNLGLYGVATLPGQLLMSGGTLVPFDNTVISHDNGGSANFNWNASMDANTLARITELNVLSNAVVRSMGGRLTNGVLYEASFGGGIGILNDLVFIQHDSGGRANFQWHDPDEETLLRWGDYLEYAPEQLQLANNTGVPSAGDIGAGNGWLAVSNGVWVFYSTADGSTLTTKYLP